MFRVLSCLFVCYCLCVIVFVNVCFRVCVCVCVCVLVCVCESVCDSVCVCVIVCTITESLMCEAVFPFHYVKQQEEGIILSAVAFAVPVGHTHVRATQDYHITNTVGKIHGRSKYPPTHTQRWATC